MTRDEIIQCGRNIDAEYVVIQTLHDGRHPHVAFVLKAEDMVATVGTSLDGHGYTEVIKLKEMS